MSIVQLLYKEIKEGDLLKLQNASNLASTGGGARDFRFPARFTPGLAAMFPRQVLRPTGECRLGDIQYQAAYGVEVSRDVEFWSEPTEARPTEVRIGRVGTVAAFADPPLLAGERVFLELARDSGGVVAARYVTESALRADPPLRSVVPEMDGAIAVTTGDNAVLFAVPAPGSSAIPPSVTPLAEGAPPVVGEAAQSTGARRGRTGRAIVPGVTSIPVAPDDPDAAQRFVEATYNYELQERATRTHQQALRVLAQYLQNLGLLPQESNIDAYVAFADAGIIFEVKSLSGSNERQQTRRAVGQLLDYAFFERPAELADGAEIDYAVVYSEQPSDETLAFLDYLDMLVLWVGDDEQSVEGTPASIGAIERFASEVRGAGGRTDTVESS